MVEAPERWQAPQKKLAWKPKILDATSYGAVCPQTGEIGPFEPPTMAEHCLFLNIYTPMGNASNNALPVLLYIHGGGYLQGWGSYELYRGTYFANTTNTIVVTLNYRLGILGFLTSPDFDGNFGIMDQRMAIQWVHDNIASFGGDPNRVTLAGQSVGGVSVAIHYSSPEYSEGLFSRVIIQSSPIYMQFRDRTSSYPFSQIFANLVGCQYRDVACLLQVNMSMILFAQENDIWLPLPLSTRTDMPWQPTLDGRVILGQPMTRLEQGHVCKSAKQVLLGTVKNETLSFVYQVISRMSPLVFDEIMFAWLGVFNATLVIPAYKSFMQPLDARDAFSMMSTDYYFVCPLRRIARALSSLSIDVRYYAFMYSPIADPINNTTYCVNAACHGADLSFEFHTKQVAGFSFANANEIALSFAMMNQFLHPSPQWIPFSTSNDAIFMFDIVTSKMRSAYRKDACDIWDMILHKG